MTAPDMIYLNKIHPEPYWFKDKQVDSDIEYIRKDALLEWAKNELNKLEALSDNDAVYWGQRNAFKQAIDKINSL